jgi:hypothetical protein
MVSIIKFINFVLLPSIKKFLSDLACSFPSCVVGCCIGNQHDRVGTARTVLTDSRYATIAFYSSIHCRTHCHIHYMRKKITTITVSFMISSNTFQFLCFISRYIIRINFSVLNKHLVGKSSKIGNVLVIR